MNEEKKDKKIKQVMGSIENRIRHTYNCGYLHGYEDGQKHDADMLEQIKDLIRESDKNHAYTLSYPAYVFITRLKKIVGWQLEDYEERKTETETWISMDKSRKITVPKGTFEKILSDADDDFDI